MRSRGMRRPLRLSSWSYLLCPITGGTSYDGAEAGTSPLVRSDGGLAPVVQVTLGESRDCLLPREAHQMQQPTNQRGQDDGPWYPRITRPLRSLHGSWGGKQRPPAPYEEQGRRTESGVA